LLFSHWAVAATDVDADNMINPAIIARIIERLSVKILALRQRGSTFRDSLKPWLFEPSLMIVAEGRMLASGYIRISAGCN
jgi:hypothetical protein